MTATSEKFVAAFSAALEEIYSNILNKQTTNFTELGKKHHLGVYTHSIRKVLREKGLINSECTAWNPNYTKPNVHLAQTIYVRCKEINAMRQRKYQAKKKSQDASIKTLYSLDETVELVKHYGLLKIIWKCLF